MGSQAENTSCVGYGFELWFDAVYDSFWNRPFLGARTHIPSEFCKQIKCNAPTHAMLYEK